MGPREGGLAGAHAVHHVGVGRVVDRVAREDREVPQGVGRVGAQGLGEGREREVPGARLREDPRARERPQHPVQGTLVHAGALGELGDGALPAREPVCDAELGRNRQALGDDLREDQAEELLGHAPGVVSRFVIHCGEPRFAGRGKPVIEMG